MARLVIFKETERSAEELANSIDKYLEHAWKTIKPFDIETTFSWNHHRNRISIQGRKFTAEVVLIPKGIIVRAEIPTILYPFKKTIEERISRAIDTILKDSLRKEG